MEHPEGAVTILYVVLIAMAAAALWLLHSWWFPYTRCRRCLKHSAAGRGLGSTWRAYNRCGACGGKGETVRTGARIVSKATSRPVRGSEEK